MRKMRVKACGPKNEVLRTLQNVNGVVSVSILPERDADSTSFLVEAQTNVDVRASIFHALAQNDYPMIGLEGFYSSLEDVFIAILDKNKKEGNA